MNVVAIGIVVIIITPIVFGLLGYVVALGQRMKEVEARIESVSESLRTYESLIDMKMDTLSLIVLNNKEKGAKA